MPWNCVDPIAVGAQIVTALQVMVAREIDVNNNTVITVGTFHAGSARNIIPQKAELGATIRTFGDAQRQLIRAKIERLVQNICEAAEAPYRLDYEIGTSSVYNDPELLAKIMPSIERLLGGKEFARQIPPDTGGEDFSEFARLTPSVILWLGVAPPRDGKDRPPFADFHGRRAGNHGRCQAHVGDHPGLYRWREVTRPASADLDLPGDLGKGLPLPREN